MTGCNSKEKKISTYEKEDNEISNISNDDNIVTIENIKIQQDIENELIVLKGYIESGEILWTYNTNIKYKNDSEGPNIYYGNKNTYILHNGDLIAISKLDGKELWTKTDIDEIDVGSAIEVGNKIFIENGYVGDIKVYVLNIDNGETIKLIKGIEQYAKKSSKYDFEEFYNLSGKIEMKDQNTVVIKVTDTDDYGNDLGEVGRLEIDTNDYSVKFILD